MRWLYLEKGIARSADEDAWDLHRQGVLTLGLAEKFF